MGGNVSDNAPCVVALCPDCGGLTAVTTEPRFDFAKIAEWARRGDALHTETVQWAKDATLCTCRRVVAA